MGFNLFKTLGINDVVKDVLPIAAPFLPGPWGAVAGAVGGLMQGAEADKRAGAYAGKIDEQTKAMLSLVNEFYRPILEQMAASARTPLTPGSPAPSGDPYNLAGRAGALNPYGESTRNAILAGDRSATARAYQDAAQLARSDLAGTGVSMDSTVAPAIARIRSDQARQQAQIGAGLLQRGAEWNADARIGAEQETYRRLRSLEDTNFDRSQQQFQNLSHILSNLSGLQTQGIGSYGGLQGMYATESGNTLKGLGDFSKVLADSGILDKVFGTKRPATAGSGRMDTNQSGGYTTAQGLKVPTITYNPQKPFFSEKKRIF